ncbi:hypothetical protein JTB14_037720 [Gonioctena quinquepunctata]|nr:hypothetical protein JTB14_037720 [Gonioctena quinquepunctata]
MEASRGWATSGSINAKPRQAGLCCGDLGTDAFAQQPKEVGGDIPPAQQAQSSESARTSTLTESIPIEKKVSPTPEKTVTTDREGAHQLSERPVDHKPRHPKVTIELLQANLQHAKVATYTISRRFANELLNVALIQEPWTTGSGRINGLGNISGKYSTAREIKSGHVSHKENTLLVYYSQIFDPKTWWL